MSLQPRVWFNFLVPPLRPWERAAIDAWLEASDPDTREIGFSQLRQLNLAQRLAGGEDVYLHRIRYGLRKCDCDRLLPISETERQAAEVRLSINGRKSRAQIWIVNGQIFELQFRNLPRRLSRSARVEVLDLSTGPFPSNRKGEELAASLPPDYVELVRGGGPDGPEIDGIGVLTLDQVYVAGSHWMLAEMPDIGMLGVAVDGEDRDVWFLFYDGRPPQRLSPSFREALTKARSIE